MSPFHQHGYCTLFPEFSCIQIDITIFSECNKTLANTFNLLGSFVTNFLKGSPFRE